MSMLSSHQYLIYGGQNSLNVLNQNIYLLKTNGTASLKTVYNPTRLEKEELRPAARRNHSAIYSHHNLIVIGGHDSDDNILCDIWRFDMSTLS